MKKKLICIILTLVLLSVFSTPATAMAAKPAGFAANGVVTWITPGDVFPAGNSGRWVVTERELIGNLYGDISGDFTMTYKANVESVYTQAGNLHGTLVVGDYELNVNGKIQPLVYMDTMWVPNPDPVTNPVVPYIEVPLYKLAIDGKWTFIDGAKGTGDFAAWLVFIPTPEGHVGYIVESNVSLSGSWQP